MMYKELLENIEDEKIKDISNGELPEDFIDELEDSIENKTIHMGIGLLTTFEGPFNTPTLLVDFNGYKAIILRDDMDYQIKLRSLAAYVHKEIPFIVKAVDLKHGIIFLSRKEAQLQILEITKEELQNGAILEAEVTGLLDYGAYVMLRGGAYALLRNADFSDSYVRVSDYLDVGDRVKVKLNSISKNGKISVEPINKIQVDSLLNFDMLEENQVIAGIVRSVRPFGVFVSLVPGVDGLCSVPEVGEIEEGTKVKYKITKKHYDDEGNGLIRGTIIEVLE